MLRFVPVFLAAVFSLVVLTPQVYAQAQPGIIAGTGQVTSQVSGINKAAMAQTAVAEAKAVFTARGGITPKVVLIAQNMVDPDNYITDEIHQQFGSSVPIAGVELDWPDYFPYSIEDFPALETVRSVVIMALGGDGITVQTALGAADFSNNSASQAQLAGTRLAQALSPVAGKKNLLLIMGPMHTPLNASVVQGIKQVWGTPLPSHIRAIGWAGSYWGSPVYRSDGTKTAQSSALRGVLITGDFQWALTGVSSGYRWEDNPESYVTAELSDQIDTMTTELGRVPDVTFLVISHPAWDYYPAIRNTFAQKLGSSSALFGHHAGSETGHDSTAGDLIGDLDHFFMAGIAANTSTPQPSPTPVVTPSPTSTPVATPSPTPTPVPSPSPTPSPTPDPEDLNYDGTVNALDIKLFLPFYTNTQCLVGLCDFLPDAQINSFDFAYFTRFF